MSGEREPTCSSYESTDGEGDGCERRLTAAEELHEHLVDCRSLYGSRFLNAPLSLAAIQTFDPLGASLVSSGSRDEGGDGVDVSTVVTVLWLRDGVRATTPGAPVGVLVTFQYWVGFRVIAERRYASVAEAEEEAREVGSVPWSPDKVLSAAAGWTLLPYSDAGDEGDAFRDCSDSPCEGEKPGERTTSYESLMALLVHQYL